MILPESTGINRSPPDSTAESTESCTENRRIGHASKPPILIIFPHFRSLFTLFGNCPCYGVLRKGVLVFSCESVSSFLENLDATNIEKLAATGAKLYYAWQAPKTTIFVPVGRCMVEWVESGLLVYGIRATVMTSTLQGRIGG